MANNKLKELNEMLFSQMEKLSSGNLNIVDMEREVDITKQMCEVSDRIIEIHKVVLDAQKNIRYELDKDRASIINTTFSLLEEAQ